MMDKRLLNDLYWKKNLSMTEIAARCGTTHPRVYYWLKKHRIKRRSWCDSAYVKHNPDGDPFRIKEDMTPVDKELLSAALMLYWAEGHRTNRYSVELANLDPRMLKLFVMFLRTICRVSEDKITLYVQLYREFDKDRARAYWSEILRMPESQIRINEHTDKRSKLREQKSRFGIARIQVHNYKLKAWIDEQLGNCLCRLTSNAEKSSGRARWTPRRSAAPFSRGDGFQPSAEIALADN
jgi:AcrR family transcriptional regulator